MTDLLGKADNSVHGTVVVQVATGAVVPCADGTDGLGGAVLIAVQNGPSCGGSQIGDGGGRAILYVRM